MFDNIGKNFLNQLSDTFQEFISYTILLNFWLIDGILLLDYKSFKFE